MALPPPPPVLAALAAAVLATTAYAGLTPGLRENQA